MTTAVVQPGAVRGRLEAPPSKSYTHRALVAGFLARRRYEVVRPLDADDTRATRDGLIALGARFTAARGRWTLLPPVARRLSRPASIDCGQSGTTLRLLCAVAARESRSVHFVGSGRLSRRPMQPLLDSLASGGVRVTTVARRTLPLRLLGPLQPGAFSLDGSVSSQFISALLFVLPTLNGPSTLTVVGKRVSEPYVDATVAVIRAHGVALNGSRGRWSTPGHQRYRGGRFRVPGDASSAAYLWAAAAVTGGRVAVLGVDPHWPQADRRVLDVLRLSGASVREGPRRIEVNGRATDPFEVDLTASPDLYPLMGALAATIPGRSVLRGASHVIFKESNRRTETVRLVRALGGKVRASRDRLAITGSTRPRALRLRGIDDHRLVMSAAVAALGGDGTSSIADAAAVGKSFPGFWEALGSLGGVVTVR